MTTPERNPRRMLGRAMSFCAMGLAAAVLYVLSIGPALSVCARMQGRVPIGDGFLGHQFIEPIYSPLLAIADAGIGAGLLREYATLFNRPFEFDKCRAAALIESARSAIEKEDFGRARVCALYAKDWQCMYGVFELSPDFVLQELHVAQSRTKVKQSSTVLSVWLTAIRPMLRTASSEEHLPLRGGMCAMPPPYDD